MGDFWLRDGLAKDSLRPNYTWACFCGVRVFRRGISYPTIHGRDVAAISFPGTGFHTQLYMGVFTTGTGFPEGYFVQENGRYSIPWPPGYAGQASFLYFFVIFLLSRLFPVPFFIMPYP